MSGSVMGIVMVKGEVRQIPKLGLTLDEVRFCFGVPELVRALRSIGALVPVKRIGKTMVFDTAQVAEVWGRYVAGEYDARLQGVLRD